jgi:hypothetical protein
MNRIVALAVSSLALVNAGCGESVGSGPAPANDSFKLVGGGMPAFIKPGDSESVKIRIQRGSDFHLPVRLQTQASDVITANLDRNLVKDGESPDVNVRLRPNENTAPGDHKVKVIATADNDATVTLELSVRVVAK